MAAEIQLPYTATGAATYAVVRNATGSIWDNSGHSFVAYATADLDGKYKIALAEQGTASRYYTGAFPTQITAGVYAVSAYLRVGGSAAEGDPLIGAQNLEWDGSKVQSTGFTLPNNSNLAVAYGALETGTAQAGGAATITLRSGAVATDNYYKDQCVFILSGAGAGQTNRISSYVGSTRVATVETAWTTQPDNTSVYAVLGRVG